MTQHYTAEESVFEDGVRCYVCPDCAHEWPVAAQAKASDDGDADAVITDAHGTPLADGDAALAAVACDGLGRRGRCGCGRWWRAAV